ncbi:MAG: aspartate--tRNA ligase [Chloroflexota bacterium]
MAKTVTCGQLRAQDQGKTVTLMGWVHRRRDHGGLIFIDLRDREGITQVTFNPAISPEAHERAYQVRSEYVLAVTGLVSRRPTGQENLALPTGEIELLAQSLLVLNPARTPPFNINEDSPVDETLRLKYRYLDLRRERMKDNIMLRSRAVKFIRDYLWERGFVEIETPMLVKETPGGAREYLVPSRTYPGKFYALPQSPQQFKQLLMIAGFERYFQIAPCFRDEDQRADRQPQFTQLDLEMSFVDQEDILSLTEELFTALVEKLTDKRIFQKPFPRFTYREAMAKYGNDKPDIRFGLTLVDISDVVARSGFQLFSDTVAGGGQVKGLRAPGCAGYTRKQIEGLVELARQNGAKGLVTLSLTTEGPKSPLIKYLSPAEVQDIVCRLEGEPGDLLLIVADQPPVVAQALSELRLEMGTRLGLMDKDVLAFLWIVEMPLFEWSSQEGHWQSKHHQFTSPMDEDISLLDTDPGRARAKQYDIVCNGYEVGGGSIRIHRREIQEKIFQIIGMSDEEARAMFGHLLEAFEYGAPPHGGIAPGIDRLVMLLAGEDNLREVTAFPKTQSALDLLTGAPAPVSEARLRELKLKIE